jgi:hypothetical protein
MKGVQCNLNKKKKILQKKTYPTDYDIKQAHAQMRMCLLNLFISTLANMLVCCNGRKKTQILRK